MNHTQRGRTHRAIADHTNAIALAITRGAITNLERWSGPPEPNPQAPTETRTTGPTTGLTTDDDGNPIDYNDPTGQTAGTRPDIHAWALREIDRLLTQTEYDLTQVLEHLRMGLATRQAEEIKASLPAACKSCARLTDHQNRALYTPARARGLCDWCDNFDHDWNQWPPKSVLRAYHDGRRPNRRTIERALRDQRSVRT